MKRNSVILLTLLLMLPINIVIAQENSMSPIAVYAGVQLQKGAGSEFTVFSGTNINLFKVTDSTGKIKGQFFNRTGLFLSESQNKPDSANDIKAIQSLFGYEVHLSDIFTIGLGGGFLSESQEGEVLIESPLFLEFGWKPISAVGFKIGATYTPQVGGDRTWIFGGLELKPF